jgi:ribosome-associated protein
MRTDDEIISKTKLKKQMDDLQQLGLELVRLSDKQLAQFELGDSLLEAIKFARTIKANGALRRHCQYIGKLMRTVDEVYVRETLLVVMGESHHNTRILHECEQWRDKLLASDDELNLFIAKYPNTDITELRQLIRSVRKELIAGKNKNYRGLFQLIRQQIT